MRMHPHRFVQATSPLTSQRASPRFAPSIAPSHKQSNKQSNKRPMTRSILRPLGAALAAPLACVVMALSACSTSSTDLVHLPDGQSGFAVNCSGAGSGSSWAECYQRAGTACGASGYDIVSKDNDDGAAAGGGVGNLATANIKSRSMIVRCK